MEKKNVYVGHRYVPKIFGVWDKLKSYEGLSIVTWEGTSYTSKKRVPEGVDILNEEYWVVTGNYNAQVEGYRQEVREMKEDVNNKADIDYVETEFSEVKSNIDSLNKDFNQIGYSVFNFGAVGDFDGTTGTDDTEAIQRAINELPTASTIILGNHYCKGTIHVPVNKRHRFIGQSYTQASAFSTVESGITFATGVERGFDIKGRASFENFTIKKENRDRLGTGIYAEDGSVTTRNMTIQGFDTCFRGIRGYYNKFHDTYTGYANKGYVFTNCYNIIMSGVSVDILEQTGIELHNGSTLKMFGGAIENSKSVGLGIYSRSHANIFGVYFEVSSGRTILLSSDTSINSIGSHCYLLNNVDSFISLEGLESTVNTRIFSRNNEFNYSSGNGSTTVYKLNYGDNGSYVDIAGDNWGNTVGENVNYIDYELFLNRNSGEGNYKIMLPSNNPDSNIKNIDISKNRLEPKKMIEGINEWVVNSNSYFYKDPFGIVHINVSLTGGIKDVNTTLFNLPVGYRPKNNTSIVGVTRTSASEGRGINFVLFTNGNIQTRGTLQNEVYINASFRVDS